MKISGNQQTEPLVYAIGDIHGELSLVQELHQKIEEDSNGAPSIVVYLGDYVDRGPDSKGVLDLLIDHPIKNSKSIYLLGNHEFAMLKFIDNQMDYAQWMAWGGDEALHSYGVRVISPYSTRDQIDQVRKELIRVLPKSHIDFLRNLKPYYEYKDFLFVHAGVRPGIPIKEQKLHDLIMIREEFLKKPVKFGKLIVHGHTIFVDPHVRQGSVGIDTGAYKTGKLTAVLLESKRFRFIYAQK